MRPKSTVLELIADDIRSNIGFGIIILESVFKINASRDPVIYVVRFQEGSLDSNIS